MHPKTFSDNTTTASKTTKDTRPNFSMSKKLGSLIKAKYLQINIVVVLAVPLIWDFTVHTLYSGCIYCIVAE